jgi:hypothetical protein
LAIQRSYEQFERWEKPMATGEWLGRLGDALGLGPIALEPGRFVPVQLEGEITVWLGLSGDGTSLHLRAAVATLPDDPAAQLALFESLLALNHVENSTAGSTLALDPERGEAVLWEELAGPVLTQEAQGRAAVAAFLARAAEIVRQLGEQESAPPQLEETGVAYIQAQFLRA